MHEPDFNELTAFIERRLGEAERQRVITHLATCRACREVVAALTATSDVTQPATVGGWRLMTGWLPLAAMLVVVVIVGVVYNQNITPVTTTTPAEPAGDATPPSIAPAPPAVTSPTPPPQPAPQPAEDLTQVRGNERTVDGKTFRFAAGEWIDASYDPQQLLPVVEVATAAEREDLLRRVPALKPYAALGSRVTVVLGGTVYRISS
jgi:hypothetical protein